jgi:hypothetical protein
MSWVDVTTAVGTAGAAVVALALGSRAEWRAIRTERLTKEENEHRQALHVSAWMLVEQDDGKGLHEMGVDDPTFDRRKACIYSIVQNASEEPVWDVVVFTPMLVEKHEGSSELKFAEAQDEIISIGPHETYKSEIKIITLPISRFPLKVEFRDNAGRQWCRDERGRLHRGRSSEPAMGFVDEVAGSSD